MSFWGTLGSALIGGIFGQKAADKQAGAYSDAAAAAGAQNAAAIAAQKEMGEKSLLAQLYMAQLQRQQMIEDRNIGNQLGFEREARALEAIEPFRRLGYAAVPQIYQLFQDTLAKQHTPLQAEVPPELAAMHAQREQDHLKMLGRRSALQGIAGSPVATSMIGDQMRRLGLDHDLQGYQTGLQRAAMEDNRANALDKTKYGQALDLLNMGARMGTQGYGLAQATQPNLASVYGDLGRNVGSTLNSLGSGMAGGYNQAAANAGNIGMQAASGAALPWANWGKQLQQGLGMMTMGGGGGGSSMGDAYSFIAPAVTQGMGAIYNYGGGDSSPGNPYIGAMTNFMTGWG